MRRKGYFDENWGEIISELVTIPMVLESYGYRTNRRRRIPCMLHGGKHNNFGYNDHVYHCFVCDERGNVAQLVQQLFGLDYKEALVKLDHDFNLGVTSGALPLKEKLRIKKVMQERTRRQVEKENHRLEYLAVAKLHQYLNRALIIYRPIDPDQDADQWHPVFVAAAQRLSYLKYWLDENMERMEG